ncbi:MAG: UDP-N-acetylmuramate--L-alanine ligase [Phycisphaerales bacterium]
MNSTTPNAARSAVANDPLFAGKHIHFVGIGGSGMCGLARMLRSRGAIVGGSDVAESEATSALVEEGIAVRLEQSSGWLPDQCDLVIASAAIKPEHPELMAAQRRGVQAISYAEGLGLAQRGRTTVCISGTHGKSTTTALLSHVLLACGLDPSFIVGAVCPQIGGGSRTGAATIPMGPRRGEPGVLVCEACEFNRSFHQHQPSVALINNIEEDHLDCYRGIEEIVGAFHEFARLVPAAAVDGRLLIAHDGAHRREVTAGLACAVATFGFNPAADYHVVYDAAARTTAVRHRQRELGRWSMPLPGEHNALNSAAAAILASWLGADWPTIGAAIGSFAGLDRRSQRLGVRHVPGGSVVVYDDYGHHPTECEKTLRAIRTMENPRRLICVFQPHQHSRTRFLLEQFAQSFSVCDVVIVPHIYFVRDSEAEKTKVSATDLVDRLRRRGVTAMHLYPFEAIVEQLEVICRDGDLVVVMGAGPVWQVGRELLAGGNQ